MTLAPCVEIVLDSINAAGVRLTTVRLTTSTRLQLRLQGQSDCVTTIGRPIRSVSSEEVAGATPAEAELYRRARALEGAFRKAGIPTISDHIALAFCLATTVLTTTDAAALRLSPEFAEDAQLSAAVQSAMRSSTPRFTRKGEWHLPFISEAERRTDERLLTRISAARCLGTLDAQASVTDHFRVYGELVAGREDRSALAHVAIPAAARRWLPSSLRTWNHLRVMVERGDLQSFSERTAS